MGKNTKKIKISFWEKMQSRKKRVLPAILVSLIIPFLLCVSVPFEIYCNNSSEFVFRAIDFLPYCIMFMLGIASFFVSLLLLLPNVAYKVMLYFLLGLGFMLFLQGTYLNGNLSLTGDNMVGSEITTAKMVVNIIIWLAVMASFITIPLVIKDKAGYIRLGTIVLSVIVVATQVMSVTFSSINNKDAFLPPEQRNESENAANKETPLTTKNLTNLSTSNNIFYFVVDRFDEEIAESTKEVHPTIYNELTGFTWFQDNISIYGHTFPAVCNMLTGAGFDASQKREDYLDQAYKADNPLKELHEMGYDINIYTDLYYSYTGRNMPSYISNLEKGEYVIEDRFGLSFRMVQLSLFRSVPLFAKWAFKDINSSTCNSYSNYHSESAEVNYQTSNKGAKKLVDIKGFTKTNNKQFSFIHTEGAHNLEPDYSSSAITIPSVANATKNSFRVINSYLQKLKEYGLYKDSTIIITGDHGSAKNDLTPRTSPTLTALFVKPAGVDSGELKISKAQTSHADIWATIHKSEGITSRFNSGKNVFDIGEGELRTRYYIWHTYSGATDEYIYKICGEGKNFDNWHEERYTHYNKALMD
mgnify:FL=1